MKWTKKKNFQIKNWKKIVKVSSKIFLFFYWNVQVKIASDIFNRMIKNSLFLIIASIAISGIVAF